MRNQVDFSLKKNDIVSVLSDLAHGNLLGLCDLIPAEDAYVLNQRMGRLRLKVPATSQFVRLQINRRQEHFKKRGQGTSQKHIYRRDFDSLPIPFPAPAEQEAIAEALSDADAHIGALEQLIAKKRHLKQGAMQELLTGKRRLSGFEVKPGYKQTEVGVIPEDWDITTVGKEFSIQLGKMLDSEKNVGVEKPYLGNRAVQWGRIDLSDIGVIKLTPSDLQHYRLREGDLLVCEKAHPVVPG